MDTSHQLISKYMPNEYSIEIHNYITEQIRFHEQQFAHIDDDGGTQDDRSQRRLREVAEHRSQEQQGGSDKAGGDDGRQLGVGSDRGGYERAAGAR